MFNLISVITNTSKIFDNNLILCDKAQSFVELVVILIKLMRTTVSR